MYKNVAETIEKYVVIIVCLVMCIDAFVFLIGIIGMFIDGSTFPILILSILIAVLTYVSGAFLQGCADLINNSNKQTKILEEIRNHLVQINNNENKGGEQ